MGRTLYYDIYGDLERGPITAARRRKILDALAAMNSTFTWEHGKPKLELFPHCQITLEHGGAGKLGEGQAMVEEDDWNAALTIRFLRWVASLLPEYGFIGLHDEGGYVLAYYVNFDREAIWLNTIRTDRYLEYLREFAPLRISDFEQRLDAAERGDWFKQVPAALYRYCPELAEVEYSMSLEQFKALTLEDAADHIVFPWQSVQS